MKKIAIICAEFNKTITSQLLTNCVLALEEAGINSNNIDIFYVPGAMEIPFQISYLFNRKKGEYGGMIAIGAVIRGETAHFEYVSKSVQEGITQLNLRGDIPIIFGVLATENLEQALERADKNKKNKGKEFALALIKMLNNINT